jgi:hypothetical protein
MRTGAVPKVAFFGRRSSFQIAALPPTAMIYTICGARPLSRRLDRLEELRAVFALVADR